MEPANQDAVQRVDARRTGERSQGGEASDKPAEGGGVHNYQRINLIAAASVASNPGAKLVPELSKRRDSYGVSRGEMAEALGLTAQQYFGIEHGAYAVSEQGWILIGATLLRLAGQVRR